MCRLPRNSDDIAPCLEQPGFRCAQSGLRASEDSPLLLTYCASTAYLLPIYCERAGLAISVRTMRASASGTADPDLAALNPGYDASRRTCLVGELLEHCTQRAGGANALRERQAQSRALELQ